MADQHFFQFLGVGDARNLELGSSSAVYERNGEPSLLIDCGPTTEARCMARYGRLPTGIFITHIHMDHVAGLEGLFYSAWFSASQRGKIKLYLPLGLVKYFHARLATFPNLLAEGGVNFYDAFQTVIVSERFWHDSLEFLVFPVRHHAPDSAFGIALPGKFVYTGDTRPIPEVLDTFNSGEVIFHDVALRGNPSHSGALELQAEYRPELLDRLRVYHYDSSASAEKLIELGFAVVPVSGRFELAP